MYCNCISGFFCVFHGFNGYAKFIHANITNGFIVIFLHMAKRMNDFIHKLLWYAYAHFTKVLLVKETQYMYSILLKYLIYMYINAGK